MSEKIRRYAENEHGNDYVVGDIHGMFRKLEGALTAINFNELKDRLFCTGDMVDRGPDSEESMDWLAKPWFHTVRGNHEQMAIDAAAGYYEPSNYISNGGKWFLNLEKSHQELFAHEFERLPIVSEIETPSGLIGIVHADCPLSDWSAMKDILSQGDEYAKSFEQMLIWSRNKISRGDISPVKNIHQIYVGHTPVTAKK